MNFGNKQNVDVTLAVSSVHCCLLSSSCIGANRRLIWSGDVYEVPCIRCLIVGDRLTDRQTYKHAHLST